MISLSSSPTELRKQLVMVTWGDAQDHPDKWVDEADAEAFGEVDVTVTSIGWVVSKTAKYLTLGADYDPIDKDYGRVTKIPLGMISSLTLLEPASP